LPKPPAGVIIAWAVTYLYAIIFWAIEFTHKNFAGHMLASTPIGFWYTLVFGGLVMGLIIGVYLATSLSKPESK